MLIGKKKPSNIAGIMGGNASQPAAMLGQSTVDPLERAQQKMAGRTQGGAVAGIKSPKARPKRTMMTNYGIK
tara:strand:- start:162 stop:377 length:216 start_codon:yes stop_codon:yes gene_type:complete